MKKLVLLMLTIACCATGSYAKKTTKFMFRDVQARAADAVTSTLVKPFVVEVEILENGNKIKDEWHFSAEDVEIAMRGEIDNVRAAGIYQSTQRHECDIIIGVLCNVETENNGGYKVTITGYPGKFTNMHSATTDDYEWMRIQLLSKESDKSKITPVIKTNN